MKYVFIATICSLICCFMLNSVPSLAEMPHRSMISYDSVAGQELLATSEHRGDFAKLSRYFITQQNMGFCSVASSVMALNALEIDKPAVLAWRTHRLFTQDNFFTDRVKNRFTLEYVRKHGMNLQEIHYALETFGVNVQVHVGDNLDANKLRELLIDALNDPNKIVLSEYHRQALGQVGVGHFSPIAAYNESSDMLLIMDVSRYKYPPMWVGVGIFTAALRGGDSEGDPLGLAIVSGGGSDRVDTVPKR